MHEGLMLPPELAWRPATTDDVDGVTVLVAACELHDVHTVEIERDDVAADFSRAGMNLEHHSLLGFDGSTLVAWAQLGVEAGRVDADVHPDYRGRGLGAGLLAWSEARALEAEVQLLGQTKTDSDADAAQLFRRSGYAPTWTSWVLDIDVSVDQPQPSTPPRGVRVRTFAPGRDDQAVYRLIDEAFNEWEGRTSTPFEFWSTIAVGRTAFDPLASPLAVDGTDVVGAVLSLDFGDRDEGYISQVAVKKAYRSRGIARGLLQRAFQEFHRKGRSTCTLSTDSRTGALGLYERVGMRVRRSYTRFSKELPQSRGEERPVHPLDSPPPG